MMITKARKWIVIASLAEVDSVFVFVLIAPLAGYALGWSQSLRMIELLTPVFLGYLGMATQFMLIETAR